MPADTTLIRLNAQVEQQVKELEDRRFVDETIQACRDQSPKDALKVVQEARQRIPGEERLQGLEKLLADRVKRQTEEERREECVLKAREALAGGQYADAVHILEGCQAEGVATEEIGSLLEFARREEEKHRSEALMRSRAAQAQALIDASAYDEAIAFLEGALNESDDKALRFLYDQAVESRASLAKQVEAELASAAKLTREGKHAEAIQLLEALPPALRRSERVRAAESALREERQQAIFRSIGRSYADLEAGLPAGEQTMRRVAAALGDSTLAGPVAETFRGRMRAFADRAVAGLTAKYQTMIGNGDREGAAELAKQVAAIVDYAGPEAKSGWESVAARPRKIRTPARLSR
jgi:tetratricopeptide (TPR) repeat protein